MARRNLALPQAAPQAGDLESSLIASKAAFRDLKQDWDRLVERAPDSSVFQCWDWQFIWWDVFGQDRPLRIIQVRRQGQLVGLLPLYIAKAGLVPGMGLRTLRLIGYGGDTAPDDLGPIIDPDGGPGVQQALLDGLAACRHEWDAAEFDDLAPDGDFIEQIGRRGWGQAVVQPGARISYVLLPDSWDGYLALLSSNRRWKLRRGRKRLFEHAPYRFQVVQSQAELDEQYPQLVRLHHDRWQHRSDSYAFSTPAYTEFHKRVMSALLAKDQLRLMYLVGEQGVMGANYCYRWRGGFYFFQGGFARPYEPFRIGEVLMGHAIEQAITEGQRVFDMLRGEHDYKKSLTNALRLRTSLTIYRPTARMLAYRTLRGAYRGLRALTGGRASEQHGEPADAPVGAERLAPSA